MKNVRKDTRTVREAVGVFDSIESLEAAINELQCSGFERHQVSVLGSEAAVKERFGRPHVPTKLLKDDPKTPRSPDIQKEELGVGQGVIIGSGSFAGMLVTALGTGVSIASGALIPVIAVGAAWSGCLRASRRGRLWSWQPPKSG
jgi:hypothetical protein